MCIRDRCSTCDEQTANEVTIEKGIETSTDPEEKDMFGLPIDDLQIKTN